VDRSSHFVAMLAERAIEAAWVEQAVTAPDRVEDQADGTRHYLRRVPERGDRWLRVVVNRAVDPPRAVTAFFDRRLKRGP
jgi:hypothetical protein